MKVTWSQRNSYNSTVRRGYIIRLFKKKDLLDQFLAMEWPEGDNQKGRKQLDFCIQIARRYDEFLAGYIDEDYAVEELEQIERNYDDFLSENELRDFIANNLTLIEDGLMLFKKDGRVGIEYPIGKGRIDILAIDRQGIPTVIELKNVQGRQKVIGQIAYYMGWVNKHLGLGRSKGIIISKGVNPQLELAATVVNDLQIINIENIK